MEVATPHRPAEPRRSAARYVRVLKGCLFTALGLVAAAGSYILIMMARDNFHTVVPGEFYRSGRMSAGELAQCIEHRRIKSVLNLCGPSRGEWYQAETNTTFRLGVVHTDYTLSARREITDAQAVELAELLRKLPKPLLVHCDGGADRSSFASAIYLLDRGVPHRDAESQLSVWYGHIPIWRWKKSIAMDRSFERYLALHEQRHPD